jgi:hypothetical protein
LTSPYYEPDFRWVGGPRFFLTDAMARRKRSRPHRIHISIRPLFGQHRSGTYTLLPVNTVWGGKANRANIGGLEDMDD